MKEIQLTQGKVALVDDADFDRVSKFKWCAHRGRHTFYAARKLPGSGQPGTLQLLHWVILGRKYIDHRNGNGLDCQRSNLRPASPAQNARNRGKQSNNTSGFKGVARCLDGRWQAGIKINGRRHHLGRFEKAEDAAKAYDAEAIKIHEDFARLNFGGHS